jgi:hypothetical protein
MLRSVKALRLPPSSFVKSLLAKFLVSVYHITSKAISRAAGWLENLQLNKEMLLNECDGGGESRR